MNNLWQAALIQKCGQQHVNVFHVPGWYASQEDARAAAMASIGTLSWRPNRIHTNEHTASGSWVAQTVETL